VNIVILACAAMAYPHPGAVAVVAALVTIALLPRAPPFPRFGVALARSIARAACGYFPATLTFEDERAHLDAARDGQAFVVGLEPHGVLPLSIISFAAYYAHGDEEVYAMKGGFTPTMRSARALASAAIFNVPFVRHLWTWLGLDPISKQRMVDMLRAGRTVVMIPGGEAYGYWRLGPPFVPKRVANWLSETFAFAPMVFWGKFCSPIPYATPLHTVVGKAIPVKQNDNPTNAEVAAKLEEFIDAMTTLFETHKAANGCSGARLRVV
jgi:2-acylglycerol O-acyltransferase 2